MGILFYSSVPNNKISYNVNYFSFCKKWARECYLQVTGELFEVECELFGYAIYNWQSNFLIQRERKEELGSLVRLSQHQIAFTKQRFDELSVSESGAYGLNFP